MIDKIVAGDAMQFDTAVVDNVGNTYTPADGWVMTMMLRPRSTGTPIDISTTASADNLEFSISVASATTANWAAGEYGAFAVVSLSGERKTVYIGEVKILPDPATATSYDVRSTAQKAIDTLEQARLDMITAGQGFVAEYEIAGRRMKFVSAAEVQVEIDRWKAVLAEETVAARLASGQSSGRKIYTRFMR